MHANIKQCTHHWSFFRPIDVATIDAYKACGKMLYVLSLQLLVGRIEYRAIPCCIVRSLSVCIVLCRNVVM